MSKRKKLKTLYARGKKIWINDYKLPLSSIDPHTYLPMRSLEADDQPEYLLTFLRKKLEARRESRLESFVTYDDLHKIEKRLENLEHKVNETIKELQINDIYAVLGSFLFEKRNIENVKKTYYRLNKKDLSFFLLVDKLSDDLLESISKTEIALSRKFPNLSIEIEPVFSKEEIPEDSCILV